MVSHKRRGLLSGANKDALTTPNADRPVNGKLCHKEPNVRLIRRFRRWSSGKTIGHVGSPAVRLTTRIWECNSEGTNCLARGDPRAGLNTRIDHGTLGAWRFGAIGRPHNLGRFDAGARLATPLSVAKQFQWTARSTQPTGFDLLIILTTAPASETSGAW